ncbi:hypothetical protein PG993_000633 [Apiospora rasikravindrae]|uniref:U1 small nuclear ribonucleoprotein C n=1 Tax=Apiospora rasikravindrae TaxID=990691 RepID=A0ABR1U939_9PEZI
MPKFFCDYCDVYLTHDSMSVRKAHNSGRNHLRNVVDYYQQIGHEKAQSVIDSITSSYAAEGQAHANPMLPQNQPHAAHHHMPHHGAPGSGLPPLPLPPGAGAPGFPMPPPGPGGLPFPLPAGMPPLPGMPGGPPPPLGAFGGPGMPRKYTTSLPSKHLRRRRFEPYSAITAASRPRSNHSFSVKAPPGGRGMPAFPPPGGLPFPPPGGLPFPPPGGAGAPPFPFPGMPPPGQFPTPPGAPPLTPQVSRALPDVRNETALRVERGVLNVRNHTRPWISKVTIHGVGELLPTVVRQLVEESRHPPLTKLRRVTDLDTGWTEKCT